MSPTTWVGVWQGKIFSGWTDHIRPLPSLHEGVPLPAAAKTDEKHQGHPALLLGAQRPYAMPMWQWDCLRGAAARRRAVYHPAYARNYTNRRLRRTLDFAAAAGT